MTTTDEGLDTDTAEDKRRAEWLDDAQMFLDWLDEHRDLIPVTPIDLRRWGWTPDEFTGLVRAIGSGEKVSTDYSLGVDRKFGVHTLGVRSTHARALCQKVETGETETKEIYVAVGDEIPEGARLVSVRAISTYEVDAPVTKWECPPSMLAGSEEG